MHPYCVLDEAVGAYAVPDQARVLAARVLVATCGAAGMLREAFPDLDPGSAAGAGGQGLGITHVMIDEAGQVGSRSRCPYPWLIAVSDVQAR